MASQNGQPAPLALELDEFSFAPADSAEARSARTLFDSLARTGHTYQPKLLIATSVPEVAYA